MKRNILIIIIFILVLANIFILTPKEDTIETSANASSKYKILVDVEESKMYIIENGVCTKTYTCAGGKYSTPSPIGTWKIVSKGKWGEGFGGRWLRPKCSMGKFWHSWYNRNIFCRLGKLTWLHSYEQ